MAAMLTVEHLSIRAGRTELVHDVSFDIATNGRAMARVIAAAEKVKKILSANQQAPVNIESLMNDVDVSAMMTRQEFEAMVEPLLNRAHIPLEQALAEAKITKDDIDFVEVLGGGTRVPSLKERIQTFFGKPLSFTLNQDEAVARGCAFSCAILSPVFRVRDFTVHDIISYPIEFAWEKAPDIPDEDTSLTVFNKGNVLPSTKILTFYRKQPFDLEARYAKPEDLPGKISPWIGRFSVKGVKADGKEDFMVCKLKARVNIHGVLNVESGYYVEDQDVEEEVKEEERKDEGEIKDPDVSKVGPDAFPNDFAVLGGREAKRMRVLSPPSDGDAPTTADMPEVKWDPKLTRGFRKAMDTEGASKEEAPKKTRKVKKQIRKGDLAIVSGTSSLDASIKNIFQEKENNMVMEDKLVADTEEKKNELETYIYDMRNKLEDQYAEFASDEEKEKLLAKLSETEVSWALRTADQRSAGGLLLTDP